MEVGPPHPTHYTQSLTYFSIYPPFPLLYALFNRYGCNNVAALSSSSFLHQVVTCFASLYYIFAKSVIFYCSKLIKIVDFNCFSTLVVNLSILAFFRLNIIYYQSKNIHFRQIYLSCFIKIIYISIFNIIPCGQPIICSSSKISSFNIICFRIKNFFFM